MNATRPNSIPNLDIFCERCGSPNTLTAAYRKHASARTTVQYHTATVPRRRGTKLRTAPATVNAQETY